MTSPRGWRAWRGSVIVVEYLYRLRLVVHRNKSDSVQSYISSQSETTALVRGNKIDHKCKELNYHARMSIDLLSSRDARSVNPKVNLNALFQ